MLRGRHLLPGEDCHCPLHLEVKGSDKIQLHTVGLGGEAEDRLLEPGHFWKKKKTFSIGYKKCWARCWAHSAHHVFKDFPKLQKGLICLARFQEVLVPNLLDLGARGWDAVLPVFQPREPGLRRTSARSLVHEATTCPPSPPSACYGTSLGGAPTSTPQCTLLGLRRCLLGGNRALRC